MQVNCSTSKLTVPGAHSVAFADPTGQNVPSGHVRHCSLLVITSKLASMLDLRALSLMDEGAYERSIELLTEAISLSPAEPTLPLHRALAHTGRDDYEPALKDLDACLAAGGESADVHFLRAKLSLLGKDLQAARIAVDEVMSLAA